MTVGLLNALYTYQGRQVSGEELAERACEIEIERCGKPIGKQDQYIAALGGIRDLRFGPGDEVIADEVELEPASRRALQRQIMLFYTGVTRSANNILAEQKAKVASTRPHLDQLRDLAGLAVERLRDGDVDAIGPRSARAGKPSGSSRRSLQRPDRTHCRPSARCGSVRGQG